MNPKIVMPFTTMAIAVVALLFASGPLASQQASAFVVVHVHHFYGSGFHHFYGGYGFHRHFYGGYGFHRHFYGGYGFHRHFYGGYGFHRHY
jgi:hypothetical protein